jgi:hypothetical protein
VSARREAQARRARPRAIEHGRQDGLRIVKIRVEAAARARVRRRDESGPLAARAQL